MPETDAREAADEEATERPRPVPDDDDDDDDDEVGVREAQGVGTAAPWTPTPTWPARQFLQANPTAAIEIIFPVVYEEDRSKKITDLSAARNESVITHRRMAEQVAKELGVEEYDYLAEQRQIASERPAVPPALMSEPPATGAGDGLVPSTLVTPPNGKAEPVPATTHDPEMPRGRRADLSGDATAEFRRQQRQAEAVIRDIGAELARLREGATRDAFAQTLGAVEKLTRTLADVLTQQRTLVEAATRPAPTPTVHVEAPRVEVKPADVHVELPAIPTPEVVNIHTPQPERRIVDKRVEYDTQGRAVRVTEVDDRGHTRISRVKRDEQGRITGLEAEEA